MPPPLQNFLKPGVLTYLTVVYDTADKGITEIAPINSNLSLWLDASELTSAGATWTDKSNNNSATKNGSPSVVTNAYNGLSVMRYTSGGYHEWNDLNDIRTVFWVLKADSTNTGFMLGDDNKYNFHSSSGDSAAANFWGNHAATWFVVESTDLMVHQSTV